jgi:hypothetical protein
VSGQLSLRPIDENDYSVMRETRPIGRIRRRPVARPGDVELVGHRNVNGDGEGGLLS